MDLLIVGGMPVSNVVAALNEAVGNGVGIGGGGIEIAGLIFAFDVVEDENRTVALVPPIGAAAVDAAAEIPPAAKKFVDPTRPLSISFNRFFCLMRYSSSVFFRLSFSISSR